MPISNLEVVLLEVTSKLLRQLARDEAFGSQWEGQFQRPYRRELTSTVESLAGFGLAQKRFHRNVLADNLLLRLEAPYTARLSDFGLAKANYHQSIQSDQLFPTGPELSEVDQIELAEPDAETLQAWNDALAQLDASLLRATDLAEESAEGYAAAARRLELRL